jgi:hypothetical protein
MFCNSEHTHFKCILWNIEHLIGTDVNLLYIQTTVSHKAMPNFGWLFTGLVSVKNITSTWVKIKTVDGRGETQTHRFN